MVSMLLLSLHEKLHLSIALMSLITESAGGTVADMSISHGTEEVYWCNCLYSWGPIFFYRQEEDGIPYCN